MSETVYLLNMFPDYEPPEEIRKALSQAALVWQWISGRKTAA